MGIATGGVAGLGAWATQRSWSSVGQIEVRAARNPKLARDAAALGVRPGQLLGNQLALGGVGLAIAVVVWPAFGLAPALVVLWLGLMGYVALARSRVARATAARRSMAEAALGAAELIALALAGGQSLARAARRASEKLPERMRASTDPWEHWIALGEASDTPSLVSLGEVCRQGAAGAPAREMLVRWARTEASAQLANKLTRAQGRSAALVVPLVLVGASWLGVLLYGLLASLKI